MVHFTPHSDLVFNTVGHTMPARWISDHILLQITMVHFTPYSTPSWDGVCPAVFYTRSLWCTSHHIKHHISMVCFPLYSTPDYYGGFHTIFHAILVWCVSHCIIFYTRALWYISHHILNHIGMVRVPLYSTTDNYSGFHTIWYSPLYWCGVCPTVFCIRCLWWIAHHIPRHFGMVHVPLYYILHQGTMVHFTPYSKPSWYGACPTVLYSTPRHY